MKIDSAFVDSVARKALQEFGAPGLSIALVAGQDKVCRAYGVADADTGEEMSVDTAFALASPTKSFTALTMAILEAEGAFDWDDPVARVAPDLCAGRSEHLQPVTIGDLLSHQAGFGWHDPLWYNSPWDRTTVIRKAWQAGPVREPRSCFQYSNITYMLAGEVVARISGTSYEDAVRRRVFEPLGLHSAHFSSERPLPPVRYARPHAVTDGRLHRIAVPEIAKANAACGLQATACDLAAWLSYLCKPGDRDIPVRALESVIAPRVAVGPCEGARFYTLFGQPDWMEYGFGWFLRRYRGHRVAFHTGRLPGSGTHIAVLPDLGLGIAVLTNVTFACLAEAVALAILEQFVGGPQTDWMSYYRLVSKELAAAGRPPATCDSADGEPAAGELAARTGDYVDPAYGRIHIRLRRPHGLRFGWANYRGDLRFAGGRQFHLVNLGCPLLADGETVEFLDDPQAGVLFLGRRFERVRRAPPRARTPAMAAHTAERNFARTRCLSPGLERCGMAPR